MRARVGLSFAAVLLVAAVGLRCESTDRPPGGDPLGFAGTWEEHWDTDPAHETGIITYRDGRYDVQMISVKGAPWQVSGVQLDGRVLKFTQHMVASTSRGAVRNDIHYELQVEDADTLAARTRDLRGSNDKIVWKKRGPPPERPPQVPPIVAGGPPVQPQTQAPSEVIRPRTQTTDWSAPSTPLPKAPDEVIRPGDRVVVTVGPAPVMRGTEKLTEVAALTRLVALKVNGNWVQVRVEKGDLVFTGWIDAPRYLARSNE